MSRCRNSRKRWSDEENITTSVVLVCVSRPHDVGPLLRQTEAEATGSSGYACPQVHSGCASVRRANDAGFASAFRDYPADAELQTRQFPDIADLPVGQSGWIRPWSMWNTVDGDFFINTSHSYRATKAEKDWIKVTRQHRGFDVELDHTPFEWSAIDTKYPKEGSGENLPVLSISE